MLKSCSWASSIFPAFHLENLRFRRRGAAKWTSIFARSFGTEMLTLNLQMETLEHCDLWLLLRKNRKCFKMSGASKILILRRIH